MRVLVVEDHKELAATIAVGLRREGMAVDVAFDGQEALDHASPGRYDVVVLDRDLPGLHGDEVCRALVATGSRSRVLMLTAADTIESRVDGLSLGADDYLPKPFAFAELVARIRALARRSQPALPPVLACGDIRLDTIQRVATRAGRRLELSPKELAVLELLLAADGQPLSAEELLERGWDEYADAFSSVVKVTISRLRRKLGDPPAIETVPRRLPHPRMRRRRLIAPQLAGGAAARARSACASPCSTAGSSSPRGAALLAITYVLVEPPVHRERRQLLHLAAASSAAARGTGGHPRSSSQRRRSPIVERRPGLIPRCPDVPAQLRARARTRSRAPRLNQLLIESGIALAIMALLAIWLGWLVAGRALRPLRAITERRPGDLGQQPPPAARPHRPRRRAHASSATPSTSCSSGSRPRSTPSASSPPTSRTSCARRSPRAHADRGRARRPRRQPSTRSAQMREQVLAAGEQQERLIEALLMLSRSQRGLDRPRTGRPRRASRRRSSQTLDTNGLTVAREPRSPPGRAATHA